jgi:hypothetical protein
VNANGNGRERPARAAVAQAVAARRRAQLVSDLRAVVRPASAAGTPPGSSEAAAGPSASGEPDSTGDVCDLCGITIAERHRHLLHLVERQIACACESCWNVRSGDPEYRPAGNRTLWLPALDVPDDLWASFQIPIGLAFFMESTVTACVVAMYPSPGGATESELHFDSWSRMLELNPVLTGLEPDIEGLIANRMSDPPMYVIAPIDRCYALTGTIKAHWEGISGGSGVHDAVEQFFGDLHAKATTA